MPVSMNATGEPEIAFIEAVSGNYFPMLGVGASRGRLLARCRRQRDAAPAVVISHALWTRRFANDPSIVGRTIQFNSRPFTIAGVAARDYTGGMRGLSVDAWLPILVSQQLTIGERGNWTEQRGSRGLFLLVRLRPGVGVAQAQAAFDVIAAQLYASYPQQWRTIRNTGRAVSVVAERDARLHPT
jgi:hypothetical protein